MPARDIGAIESDWIDLEPSAAGATGFSVPDRCRLSRAGVLAAGSAELLAAFTFNVCRCSR
jgi:hypothetical protein